MTLTLIRGHRLAQVNNGALAAALVMELAAEFKAGRLLRSGFVDALVGAELLSHQAAVRMATAFVRDVRTAARVDGVLVEAEFDAGASYGRALGMLRDLDEVREAAGLIVDRDWDAEFWRIVEAKAVRADRFAKNAGRDTVVASAEASGRAWRRVSDGNPCAFCAMLVGRGPVYRSARAAGSVVGRGRDISTNYKADGTRKRGGQAKGVKPRGKRGLGEKFHDHCGCTVVEVIGEWLPTAEEQRYVDLYEANAGGDASEVVAKMRRDPNARGVLNDAVEPKTQAGGSGGWSPPSQRGMAGAHSPDDDFGPIGPRGWEPPAARSQIDFDLATVEKVRAKHGRDFGAGWTDGDVFGWVQRVIDHPSDAAPEGQQFVLYGVSSGVGGVVVIARASRAKWYVATAYPITELEWQSWLDRRSH